MNEKLANQLGYYVGEYIISHHLLTLSCDEMRTRHTIQVTDEEDAEYKRLEKVWFKKAHPDLKLGKDEWYNLRTYHHNLQKKYLPEKLECHIPVLELDTEDIESFKKGVGNALWDCDVSYYSCKPEDIEIKFSGSKYIFPMIILTLGIEEIRY